MLQIISVLGLQATWSRLQPLNSATGVQAATDSVYKGNRLSEWALCDPRSFHL